MSRRFYADNFPETSIPTNCAEFSLGFDTRY
jgi:hypothetical protein